MGGRGILSNTYMTRGSFTVWSKTPTEVSFYLSAETGLKRVTIFFDDDILVERLPGL